MRAVPCRCRSWDNPGSWTTNFSALAVSPDNGQNWGIYPGSIRPASQGAVARVPFAAGNENFQQGAFLKGNDGFVYSFGTPTGRSGAAYVSRVPQAQLPDVTKYQYWNADKGSWVPSNPAAATPVIPAPVTAVAPAAQPVAAAPAESATTPLGIWATEENKGNVRVEQCGQNLCGYAVNTGERILINMKPSDGKWTGQIHDPDSGRNYDSTIAMKGTNILKVQGCAFGGMFCGGQTWKRIS